MQGHSPFGPPPTHAPMMASGYGGPPPPYGPAPGQQSPQYEFGPQENDTIRRVAGRASSWGAVSIVVGVFQVLGSFAAMRGKVGTGLGQLAGGIVSVLVGVAFRGVGSSFKAVVETHGNDIGNLLAALRSLDRAFLTQLVAVVAAFCLGIVGAILAAAVRS